MPLYDYKCATCGRGEERMLKLADLEQTQSCRHCGFAMNRQLSAPMIVADYAGYESPVTGKWIEGRKAHQEELKRTGCRIFEPGEKEAFERSRKADDEKLDQAIEASADEFIAKLPTEKRDKLAAEMDNGLDVQITRQ